MSTDSTLPTVTNINPNLARHGQLLGAWELQRRIGTGGMGEVFAARRADGRFEGLAAVKLLRPSRLGGADGADVLRRFASEQQALAKLNHPNIARLLDAGQTPDGEPYFVMELVDGAQITEACTALALPERLKLFEQLAAAVAHAHSRLLIHRDLKPSNVLVDKAGQVKLLDFGIAKALDPMEGDDTLQTQQGQRPFTPAFASPEQVRGESVTTATDIYSLGVLLYTLLTGQKPYGRTATTPHEAAQAVLHETPSRPSASTSAPQQGDALRINSSLLKGDLDNIVLKALHKEADERYSSVEAFASDIRAYLAGYPVAAQPSTRLYVLRKWASRHKLGVALGAAALAAVLTASGVATWQAVQAEAARAQAQSNLNSMKAVTREVLYSVGADIEYLPGGPPIRAKMTQNLVDNLEKLAAAPDADTGLQQDLAQALSRLALIQVDDGQDPKQREAAIKNAKRAIQWFEKTQDTQYNTTSFVISWGEAWRTIANTERLVGKFPEALAAQGKRAALLEAAATRWPSDANLLQARAGAHMSRGQILGLNTGDTAAAEPALLKAKGLFEELIATKHDLGLNLHQLSVTLGTLGLMAFRAGDDALALNYTGQSVQALEKAMALDPTNYAHLSALGIDANGACGAALALQDASFDRYCSLTRATFLELIRAEPDKPIWQMRHGVSALNTGQQAAVLGNPTEAIKRYTEGIGILEKQPTNDFNAHRLAYIRTERAALTQGAQAQADLVAAKPALVDKAPGDKDRLAWLRRARWFEVSALRSNAPAQAKDLAAQSAAAYGKANSLFALPPQHAKRLQNMQAMAN